MLLAIDVGNTNTVLGCIADGKILNIVRLQTGRNETWAELSIKLKQLLDIYEIDPRGFDGAIISSVVPEVTDNYKEAVYKLCGVRCMVVGPGIKTGMNVRIDDPGTLAGDIVVGSVAAMVCYGAPSIVIDMGTATTMSVLDETGAFIGGSISPGVKISMDALTDRTALLPGLQLDQPKKAIGRNTIDCMRSGIMLGAACMLDGMVERMEEELGCKATIVATGGIAKFVLPLCKREMIYDKDLLVKGLAVLYRENRK